MSYSAACANLPDDRRERVVTELDSWAQDPVWAQVAANIRAETALSAGAFVEVLETFVAQLGSQSPRVAWVTACRQHQFRGAVLQAPQRPSVVGRAMTLDQYARQYASANGFSEETARKKLIKSAGQIALRSDVVQTLKRTPVGRFVVWATFSEAEPGRDPFELLSHETCDILTALGLGGWNASESLVLLAYRPIEAGQAVSLHRPTICEAGESAYFRPYRDAAYPHGYTQPLLPNSREIPPQPEVIHKQIVGEGIVLPFRLSTGQGV